LSSFAFLIPFAAASLTVSGSTSDFFPRPTYMSFLKASPGRTATSPLFPLKDRALSFSLSSFSSSLALRKPRFEELLPS